MKYNPSVHAVERTRQYFGIMEEHAKNFVNQLMASAMYVTTQSDGKAVYKHAGKDVMLVVDTKQNVVVTVLPPNGEGNNTKAAVKQSAHNAIIDKARETIKRELSKASRQFTTDTRKLTLFEAELGLDIARLTVNKAKCKAPHTKALLQERINELEIGRQSVAKQLETVADRFEQMRKDAEQYIGGVAE